MNARGAFVPLCLDASRVLAISTVLLVTVFFKKSCSAAINQQSEVGSL